MKIKMFPKAREWILLQESMRKPSTEGIPKIFMSSASAAGVTTGCSHVADIQETLGLNIWQK